MANINIESIVSMSVIMSISVSAIENEINVNAAYCLNKIKKAVSLAAVMAC